MFLYIESTKAPVIRFEVLKYDKETGIGKLKGELGTEFSRDISKPSLEKWGYKVVRSETQLPMSAPKPTKAAPPATEEDDDPPEEDTPPPKKKKKKAPVEETEDE